MRLSSTDSLVCLPARAPLSHSLMCLLSSTDRFVRLPSLSLVLCLLFYSHKLPSFLYSTSLPTRPRKKLAQFGLLGRLRHRDMEISPLLCRCTNRASLSSTHSSTPPRSGNEGVSPGPEGYRREKKGGKTHAYCRWFSPRLHPSLGERDHTVLVRRRVPLVVLRWCRGGGIVASLV